MEKLTEEQKTKIEKLKRNCYFKCFVAIFLYFSWLFFTNVSIAIINALYVNSESFGFLATFGFTITIIVGCHGTIDEIQKKALEEIRKVTKE